MRHAVTIEEEIEAPPPVVWAFLADSNRWDRVVGAPPTSYDYDDGERRGSTQMFWGDASWVERGEWVEGRFFRGERHFIGGLLEMAGLKVVVRPTDAGTSVKATSWVDTRQPLPSGLVQAIDGNGIAALKRYVKAVRKATKATPARQAQEPAAAWARRVAVDADPDAILDGPTSPFDDADLEYRVARFADAPVDDDLRDRIVAWIRDRCDAELRQIRPYELARTWDLGRRELLSAFLHAARAGLFDLHWQAVCPTCRVAATLYTSLEDVGDHGWCVECDDQYALDFATNVEAVFHVSPAIRRVEHQVWCAGSPWFRPHVYALLEVPPGGERELRSLPDEDVLVRSVDGHHRLRVPGEGNSVVTIHGDHLHVDPGGDWPITFRNEGTAVVRMLVEREAWVPDMASGRDVLTLPDFHDLFGVDAPATGVDLSIGSVTVLFSDIVGSTALYTELGDGPAFARIQRHFQQMRTLIEQHEGAVVKTMGDAVMAAFVRPLDALRAGLAMIEHSRDQGGLRIRCGLHEGPCLVVRANHRLDFFGTTVNLASRLQHAADADQLILTTRLLEHRAVADLAGRHELSERIDLQPKGLPPVTCAVLRA